MADQKKWFKVWTTILLDPNHMNMSLADVGRWTRLGALMVSQGENGQLKLTPPAKVFQVAMECDSFGAAVNALKVLPNVQIEECKFDNGTTTVTMLNWFKYQVDSTAYERVKRSRYKRRGEERRTRGEKEESILSQPAHRVFAKPTPQEVETYAQSIGYKLSGSRFCDFYESKGWRIGNAPMKNWQAAVRTWKQKDQEAKSDASNGGSGISEYEAISRAARQAKGLRKVPPAGTILAGLGDLPDVQHQTGGNG